MAYIDINKIARFITDDPNIFNEENKPDEDEFEKEFKDLEGIEHKPEPADPSKKDRNQKSPNNKLDGAKQTGKAYLEWVRPDPTDQPLRQKTAQGSCPECGSPQVCPKCG